MLLEFVAFIKLRMKKPDLHRPYKVPLQTFGVTVLCLFPSFLLLLVMCLASAKTFIVNGGVIILGFCLFPAIEHLKFRKWARFDNPPMPENVLESLPIACHQCKEVTDEASVSLLPDPVFVNEPHASKSTSEETLKIE